MSQLYPLQNKRTTVQVNFNIKKRDLYFFQVIMFRHVARIF
jgi:hypothetical protein